MAKSKYFPDLENDIDTADVTQVIQGFADVESDMTTAQSDITALQTDMGDIETALDSIIEIQNTLTGGGN